MTTDGMLDEGKSARRATAESMAAKQRDISVSEFFTKNRHLLGFDNPAKALLTTIKEAVDNSLDACEEAGILPEVVVEIELDSAPREVVMPDALADALARDVAARAAFDALSYTHRKEYARWIDDAKREQTRERRVAQTLAEVARGHDAELTRRA